MPLTTSCSPEAPVSPVIVRVRIARQDGWPTDETTRATLGGAPFGIWFNKGFRVNFMLNLPKLRNSTFTLGISRLRAVAFVRRRVLNLIPLTISETERFTPSPVPALHSRTAPAAPHVPVAPSHAQSKILRPALP